MRRVIVWAQGYHSFLSSFDDKVLGMNKKNVLYTDTRHKVTFTWVLSILSMRTLTCEEHIASIQSGFLIRDLNHRQLQLIL